MIKNLTLKLNFSDKGHLYSNFIFIFSLFLVNTLFLSFRLWHTYACSYRKRGLKWILKSRKNCLFYFVIIFRKCILYQFLSRAVRMHIPILTGNQKERISGWKNGHILLKELLLKKYFEYADHLSASCFFLFLTIYHKYLLFHFLGYVMYSLFKADS